MDKKFVAIVLRAEAYRDNDKLVRLFTSDGIVNVVMKGVKKKDAKLRYFAQTLAFGEYEVAERAGRYTVKTCAFIEDLTALCSDADKFGCACLALECAERAAVSVDNAGLFVMLLKTLRAMLADISDARLIAAKFVQKVLSLSGFLLNPKNSTEPVTELLYRISRVPLDGLKDIEADDALCIKALINISVRFEKIYETKLKTLDYIKGIV